MMFLSKKGIESQEEIIDLISKDGTVSEDRYKLHLKAWYLIGKFYNKVYSPDPEEQMYFTKKAVEYYGLIVSYCRLNANASDFIADGFKSSLDAKDLLERQIIAYQSRKDQDIKQKTEL